MSETALNITGLTYRSLGDRAADYIRDLIIRHQLAPGTRLPEETFASSLGVSRACVREAFMRLESEGLLRRVRNRYTEVAVFTQKDVKEILALRCAIEVLSAKTCIENGRIPVEELRKQVDVIAARSEDAKPDTMAIMESDLDFHEIIIRASGNSRVLDVWNRLKSQMKVLLFTALINKSNVMKLRGADVHRPIIDAFIERDQDKVAVLIEEHISRSSMVSIEG